MTFDKLLDDKRLWAVKYDGDLDLLFKHLENSRFSEMTLGRKKAYGDGSYRHQSWLRIYAIKIERVYTL